MPGLPLKVRVLIVDDSKTIQNLLKNMLSQDPDFEVVGVASDPYEAREMLVALKPDVMTLDINMPKMDGLSFLKKVMEYVPIPTVVISTLVEEGSKSGVRARAMEIGAADVIPKDFLIESMQANSSEVIQRIKAAAKMR